MSVAHRPCEHIAGLSADSFPPANTPDACEDCLREGTSWVGLRLCRTCGHVGCCDSSPRQHATRHFRTTGHPVIRALTPRSAPGAAPWTWCYVHEVQGTLL
jgi:uncharacterized UBP type Zn finger protein